MSDGSVPLLNEYKHGLFRRRLLQTLFGGARVRLRVPWFVHLIQFLLWVYPLVLSTPFIVVASLEVWNPYFLSLVYAFIMGAIVLVEGLVVIYIRRCHPAQYEFDDEDSIFQIESFRGMETIDFIFASKRIVTFVLHPFISGLFSFVASFLLWPCVMEDTLPIVGIVIISLIGWPVLCSAHYSLSTRSAPETAFYRITDPLEMKYLYRPFYVFLLGATFIILR